MSGVNKYSHKTLSIRISTDGFCFCGYTPADPDSLSYHFHSTDTGITLTANFEEAWNSCPFVRAQQYDNIQVIVADNEFTCIPTEHENPDEYQIIYRSCFPQTGDSHEIISNRLNAQGVTILFPIDRELYNRLRELGNITIYCTASILLGYLAHTPIEADRYLLVHYQKGKSLLLSIADGRLQLANSFRSADAHDQIFYLLSIWKEQGLSQTDDLLLLCGDKTVEELTPLISKFLRRHEKINPNERFRPSLLNKIKDIPFDLQALLLCE